MSAVFVRYLPLSANGSQLWIGIDASSIPRTQSKTARDRRVISMPNLPESRKPISYGWQFSTMVVLPEQSSSWTYFLAQEPIASQDRAIEVAAAQL